MKYRIWEQRCAISAHAVVFRGVSKLLLLIAVVRVAITGCGTAFQRLMLEPFCYLMPDGEEP